MLNGTREQFQSSEVVVKAEVILHCSPCMFHFFSLYVFCKIVSREFLHFEKKESTSKKVFLCGHQDFILLNSSFNMSYKFTQINISAFVPSYI